MYQNKPCSFYYLKEKRGFTKKTLKCFIGPLHTNDKTSYISENTANNHFPILGKFIRLNAGNLRG